MPIHLKSSAPSSGGVNPSIVVTTEAGATVTATKGDLVVSGVADSDGVCTLVVPEAGEWTVVSELDGMSSGETIINVGVHTVSHMFASLILDDNDWDTISRVSSKGLSSNYWSIGDCKAIDISGTVGTLAVDGTYYVYILGFDHNSELEGTGITFGCFKTSVNGGIDVCLVDSKCSEFLYNGTKYFNYNHWGSSAEPYNTNYGGWKGCDLRYDILGSTDVAPSGYGATAVYSSRTGYDATETCATNPVANTLMAALPEDLRAVMKPMTIYTNNVGGYSASESHVTSSIDYLPLLAIYEIHGDGGNANSYEQNYQEQYNYFVEGNSKIRYSHSNATTIVYWISRSPHYRYSYYICCTENNGQAENTNAGISSGIAPIFRV